MDSNEMRKIMSKPVIKHSDMSAEMSTESQEIVVMVLDKFLATSKWEAAARMVKEGMDKKWGGSWHVVVGEGFGFRVTHQAKLMLHVYYNKVGVVVYKC
jgi:dynein light chain 4, axonemal